jgi:hypothetical protein
MALVLKDRVKETTTTTGTGTITLLGAATNFRPFSDIGNGNTTYYVIEDTGNAAWELGIGTYTLSGTTLSRDTILASSTGAKLTLATGTKNVFVTYPSSKGVWLDATGNVNGLGTIASGTWNGTAIGISYGGTGQTTANAGLNALLPTQTSNANKFLKTDGTNTSWSAAGLAWQAVQTSSFSASSNNGYPVNTTSASVTVTLPASPSAGDVIVITDYAGTAGTNSIVINPNGLKINTATTNFYITNNRYTVQLTYIDTTQGWLITGGLTTAPAATQYTATYFLLAGGGTGNSGGYAGGGGAGGYIASTFTATVGTTYTITIGGGGAGLAANSGTNAGNNSTISGSGLTTITAIGGGGGGNTTPAAVNNGGSSGGGGGGAFAAGSPTSGQGFTGGAGSAGGAYGAGGGGGASQAGVAGNSGAGGNGGNGIATTLTGTSVTYAGGGGGGVYQSGTRGVGGTGGGTQAGTGQAGSAAANTGSGTGGGVQAGSLGCGSGGSGVCILSVPTANYSGTGNITGTYTTGTNGSNTWIRWTLSGTYKA